MGNAQSEKVFENILTDSEIAVSLEEKEALWKIYDKDKSGDLSLDEVNKLSIDFLEVRLKKVKQALKEVEKQVKQLKKRGGDPIALMMLQGMAVGAQKMVIALLESNIKEFKNDPEKAKSVFSQFDENQDGKVSKEEFFTHIDSVLGGETFEAKAQADMGDCEMQ